MFVFTFKTICFLSPYPAALTQVSCLSSTKQKNLAGGAVRGIAKVILLFLRRAILQDNPLH